MQFINPYELLNLKEIDLADIDQIKKAKKRILADIELEDDQSILYKGKSLTKADCIRAFDELDNSDKREFYAYLVKDNKLNDFLTTGQTSFFDNHQQESIYKLSDFFEFIAPYFVAQYDKAFVNALKSNDPGLIKKLTTIPFQIKGTYQDQLYKGAYNHLKSGIHEIDTIAQQIKEEEGYYDEDTISELEEEAREKIPLEILNKLPDYFQAVRNQIANSIRNLSVYVFNTYSDAQITEDLMRLALDIDIDGITRSKLEKDFEQIRNINTERQEAAIHESTLQKYAKKLIIIKTLIQQADDKSVTLSVIKEQINGLINTTELNDLPEIFEEVRNQIALGLRNLSVSIWNNYSNGEYAIALIEFAQKINVGSDIKENLKEDLSELYELKRKIDLIKTTSSTRQTPTSSAPTTTSTKGFLILIGIAIITVIAFVLSDNLSNDNQPSSEDYNSTPKFSIPRSNNENNSSPSSSSENNNTITPLKEVIKRNPTTAREKLHQELVKRKLYSKSLQEFEQQFSKPKSREKLYNALYERELYTKSAEEFEEQFFGDLKKKELQGLGPIYPSSEQRQAERPRDTGRNPVAIPEQEAIEVSKYKGNQLQNGESPYDSFFGTGEYSNSHNNWIEFENGNKSDAIVCLVDVKSNKTIRNEYIQAGTIYKMTNVPNGTYYIKAFYGKDWNPNKIMKNGQIKGGFDSDFHFSKSDEYGDLLILRDNGSQYSTYSVTLYTVRNGNMSQQNISETEFF